MMGRWTAVEEIDERLAIKVSKIISQAGTDKLKKLNKDRKVFREEIYQSLKAGRTYVLDPNKTFVAGSAATGKTQAAASTEAVVS